MSNSQGVFARKHSLSLPWVNRLYQGNNRDILRQHIPDESVQLIYIDPPFNSKRDYGAFDDRWRWDEASQRTLNTLQEEGQYNLCAFLSLFGTSGQASYLVEMAGALTELYRVLTPTGTLYLHCDDSAVHYLKILLDVIFGADRFLAELIWRRSAGHATKRNFARVHDNILVFTKGDSYIYNQEIIRDSDVSISQWMVDVPPSQNMGKKERTGYPTQKPIELLKRIIEISSTPDDIVLDAYLGSGTTIVAANELGRRWVGIDISAQSLEITEKRLGIVRQMAMAL